MRRALATLLACVAVVVGVTALAPHHAAHPAARATLGEAAAINLKAVSNPETVTLTWEATATPLRWLIESSPAGKATWTKAELPASARSDTLKLAPGSYELRVSAVVAQSPASATATVQGSPMAIGVDTGGWGGSLLSEVVSGGIPYLRVQHAAATWASAAEPGHIGSVTVGEGGSIEGINPATYGQEVQATAKVAKPLAEEILNEPYGKWFWSDAGTAGSYTAYAKLTRAAHEALAAVSPRPAEVCPWAPGFGAGVKAAGAYAYCDGVVVHAYGGASGQDGGALGDRHEVEAAHAETGLPVYVTEVGWPTAVGKPATGDSQQWTEAQQAANVESFVRWARGLGYVKMAIVFNGVDYGTNDFYGIETTARKHKLAFAALAKVAAE